MKSIFLEDLYVMRRSWILIFTFMLFFTARVFSFIDVSDTEGALVSFIHESYFSAVMGLCGMSLFNCDANSKWDQYSKLLPVKKSCYVHSKYLMVVLSVVILWIVSILSLLINMLLTNNFNVSFLALLSGIILTSGFIIPIAGMPLCFGFGPKAGFAVCMLMYVLGISFIGITIDNSDLHETFSNTLPITVPVVLILFALSWVLSVKIYSHK